MPLYDYECPECGNEFDLFVPLASYKLKPYCPKCGSESKKILTHGHGGIQDDHPVWLDQSIRNQLQDTDSPHIPIETREQYNKHLKDNGIVPTA